jgi:hypothetical protein
MIAMYSYYDIAELGKLRASPRIGGESASLLTKRRRGSLVIGVSIVMKSTSHAAECTQM